MSWDANARKWSFYKLLNFVQIRIKVRFASQRLIATVLDTVSARAFQFHA